MWFWILGAGLVGTYYYLKGKEALKPISSVISSATYQSIPPAGLAVGQSVLVPILRRISANGSDIEMGVVDSSSPPDLLPGSTISTGFYATIPGAMYIVQITKLPPPGEKADMSTSTKGWGLCKVVGEHLPAPVGPRFLSNRDDSIVIKSSLVDAFGVGADSALQTFLFDPSKALAVPYTVPSF